MLGGRLGITRKVLSSISELDIAQVSLEAKLELVSRLEKLIQKNIRHKEYE